MDTSLNRVGFGAVPDHSREDAIRVAAELNWTVVGLSGKGYTKLHCPCGKHKKWLKKTPSDPNFYKNAIAYMRRQACSTPPAQVVSMLGEVGNKKTPRKTR